VVQAKEKSGITPTLIVAERIFNNLNERKTK